MQPARRWALGVGVRGFPLPFLTPNALRNKPRLEQSWQRHRQCSGKEGGMIRANCRARFTAADFDFIVRTLSRSRTDGVSLVDLLSESGTRDSVLDHPLLVETILSNAGHLHISSQFYFYVLARYVLQQAGIGDRKLCDYIGSLLEAFSRANQLQSPEKIDNRVHEYISDML